MFFCLNSIYYMEVMIKGFFFPLFIIMITLYEERGTEGGGGIYLKILLLKAAKKVVKKM